MFYAFICCFGALSALMLTVMGGKIMQILQLSSYRGRGVADWMKSTKGDYFVRYFSAAFFATVCMLVYTGCFGKYKYVSYLGLLFYVLFTLLFVLVTGRQKSVTPLKVTPRIVRLSMLSFVLFFAASAALLFAGKFMRIQYSLIGLMPLTVPLLVLAAHYLLWPFETLNNYGYIVKARKKLRRMPKLIRIGITGSYGKTTAKNILATMLSEKYDVLYSPSSYNTPLGIAKVVNYDLKPAHQILIAEMGARRRGDIAQLAELVKPNIGMITSVGPQHLATFGSVDTVAETKYELCEGLAPGGLAVFSADNEYTTAMYARHGGEKRLAGAGSAEGVSVWYEDVSFGPAGTCFTLSCAGKTATVTAKLLGRHVPSLISLCAAVALELGVEWETIVRSVETLAPVEHRLQPIINGDVVVLDDAYNSNAAGARNALEVLAAFEGTHIIITPGLVELGEAESEANYNLGREVYGHADYAFFVGARAEQLKRGAIEAGMDASHITICATREEAVQQSTAVTGKKVILFENDLPDNL